MTTTVRTDSDRINGSANGLLDFARTHGLGSVLDRYGPACFDTDPEPGDSISYRRLSPACESDYDSDATIFLQAPHCSGSDYSGSTVDLANYREFLEMFDGSPIVFEFHGGHGTYGVLVKLGTDCDDAEEILNVISGLSDYPVICESRLSEVEHEIAEETWDGFYRYDFRRELEKLDEDLEENEPDDEALDRLAWDLMERTGVYWEAEGYGPNMHLDLDRLVDAVTDEDLEALKAGGQS